jgi:hypothetical protein
MFLSGAQIPDIIRRSHAAGGTYYLRTTNKAGLTGCLTDYDIWMDRLVRSALYLPVIERDYTAPQAASQVGAPASAAPDQNATAPAQESAPEAPAEHPEEVLSPTGEIYHFCPDTFETDDTWQQARPIVPGVLQVHSFDSDPALYAADKDFVYMDVRAGRTITFTVQVVTNTLTLLEMYDQEGKALPEVTGGDELVWTPTVPGLYYLGVGPQPVTSRFGCTDQVGYQLRMELEPMAYLYLPVVMRSYLAP